MRVLFLVPIVGLLACSGTDDASPEELGDVGADADAIAFDSSSDASDAKSDGSDAKPEVATDAGFDPSTWKPSGKGLWIWYFDYTGLTPAQAAVRAKDAGVGWVLIKSGQDANFWTTRYTPEVVKEFTSRGMRVFAWPYITPADIPGAITAAAKAAKIPGTDGLVLDVEIEFQGAAYADEATKLCKGIRAAVPGVWLAYTSWGWPQYHTTFPYAAFEADCGDAYFPQVYWSDRGVSWSFGYDDAVKGIKSVGIKSPIWMIQSNDDIYGGGGAPSTANLNAWFDKADYRTSLWELPSKSAPSKLAQLPDLHFKNP